MKKINKSLINTNEKLLINDYEVDDSYLINSKDSFDNISVSLNNFIVDYYYKDDINYKYGLGKEVEDNINLYSNSSMNFVTEGNASINIEGILDKDLSNKYNFDIKHNSNIVIFLKSLEDVKYLHNGLFKFNISDNILVDVTIVNLLNEVSINIEGISFDLYNDSIVNVNYIDMGSFDNILNISSNLLGNNSSYNLNTFHLGISNKKDINLLTNIYGTYNNVLMNSECILKDNIIKNYKGIINFIKGSKNSDGKVLENVLVLSDNINSKSMPILLAEEDDISGIHSSLTSTLKEEEIFYMMSRGIDQLSARKMIVISKLENILKNIDNNIKEEIINKLESRLV